MDAKELWKYFDKLRGSKPIRISREVADELAPWLSNPEQVEEFILEGNGQNSIGLDYLPIVSGPIKRFLSQLISGHRVKSILDPCAGIGNLLLVANQTHPDAIAQGIDIDQELVELSQKLKMPVEIETGNSVDLLSNSKEKYDLIISNLPFGLDGGRHWKGLRRTNGEYHIALEAFLSLGDDGLMVVTCGPTIFNSNVGRKFIELLNNEGGRIEAIFNLPRRSVNTHTSIPVNFMVISKGAQGKVFQAEVTDDFAQQDLVLQNFQKGKIDKNLANGVFCDIQDLDSVSKLVLKKEVDILLKRTGLPIVSLVNLGSFKDSAEVNGAWIAIPRAIRRHAFTNADSGQVDSRHHYLFEVNTTYVSVQYLLEILNSSLGRKCLESVTTAAVSPILSRHDLQQLRLPIEPLQGQEQQLAVDAELEKLSSDIKLLRNSLWKAPNQRGEIVKELEKLLANPNSVEWMEILPFPLASILWGYHSDGEVMRKKEYLFFFFEALTEFLCVIILSGLKTNSTFFKTDVREWLKNEEMRGWHLITTFGSWHYLLGKLCKRLRKLQNGSDDDKSLLNQLFSGAGEAHMRLLTSSEIVSTVESVVQLRNQKKGHGGISNDDEDKRVLDSLYSSFKSLKELLIEGFGSVKLIRPIPNRMSWDDESDTYSTVCQLLSGTRAKFKQIEVQTSVPLSAKKMYILHDDQFTPIEILPFVQMRQAPRTEQNACYFYNRVEKNQIRMVSYHHDREAELHDPLEGMKDVVELLNPID